MKNSDQLTRDVYNFNVKLVEEDFAAGDISEAQRDASLLDLYKQFTDKIRATQ